MKKFQITFKGQVYELDVEEIGQSSVPVATKAVPAMTSAPVVTQAPKVVKTTSATTPAGGQTILAPMSGKILGLKVNKGDCVKRGDVLCILEAMKMENEIMANYTGTVSDVRVVVGQIVCTGDLLIIMG